MKKQKKILIQKIMLLSIFISTFISILFSECQVLANSITDDTIEISEEYEKYIELTDEEKKNVISPRTYTIPKKTEIVKNPLKLARMLRSTVENKYSLRDIIPENIVAKDQGFASACWAFAAMGSLESNLAIQDYKNGINPKVYDFSERHMDYATTRVFLNDKINEFGFNRVPGSIGVSGIPIAYLTNGSGAISEEEMKWQGDTSLIDISEIQNKKILTQLNDTISFPSHSVTDDKTQIKQQMKEHIMNYGGIMANINGSSLYSGSDVYNDETNAFYCNDPYLYKINHTVVIVGWDDEFSKENFNEKNRPQNDGAWIIKNSYGPEFGDEGLFYMSYEDVNIYKTLIGIVNAQTEITNENIYQHDVFGGYLRYTKSGSSKIYLATEFDKKTTGKEYLTQVSINAAERYNCKVYVNPNGTSKKMEDLQQVELATGETETFDAGYHTIEFAEPIKINSDKFVVVLEVQGTREDKVSMLVEVNFGEFYTDPKYANAANHVYDNVTIAEEKCFMAIEEEVNNNEWTATSKVNEASEGKLPNFDTTIKAFTTSNVLETISVENAPSKLSYVEGQNFDATGMVVKANYANGNSIDITDKIVINNGENLQVSQTEIIISYEGKTVTQSIQIVKNVVESIVIKEAPIKTEYWAGDNFDATGMIVEGVYTDGTTREITTYTIEDGETLGNEQTSVTINYEGKTVTQEITVKPNSLVKLEIEKAPTKVKYVAGQDFDTAGMVVKAIYANGVENEVKDYTVKDGTGLKEGQTTVTVEFEGQTVTQEITVETKVTTSINIKTVPSKTEYIQNKEELNLEGGKIEILYNDETKEEMSMTSNQIVASGFDNKVLGKQTIILTYQEKTAQFEIEIIEESKPENSNFDNMQTKVNGIRAYYFSEATQKEYVILKMELANIVKATKNEKMEYYYSLSSNPKATDIIDWVKIDKLQDSEGKLEFEINTLDILNYEDLVNADTLYLYVKEVAIKNDMSSEKITTSQKLDVENINIEEFVDGEKKSDINSGTITDPNPDSGTGKDNTTVEGSIPNAGKKLAIIFWALAIFIIARISYLRYKDIEIR